MSKRDISGWQWKTLKCKKIGKLSRQNLCDTFGAFYDNLFYDHFLGFYSFYEIKNEDRTTCNERTEVNMQYPWIG